MLIETALTYAKKVARAESLDQAQDYARVVVEQLEEVKAKIERQKAARKETA